MAETSRKILFTLGEREIIQDGIYAMIGPSNTRLIAAAYDKKSNQSTWINPGVNGSPMVMNINNALLRDEFKTSKPYIRFLGGGVEFDFDYRLTPEQSRILQNWDEELERAGVGGTRSEFG